MASDGSYADLAPYRVRDAAREWRGRSLVVATALCVLTITVAGLQILDRIKPAIPAYVQSFLLSDVPAASVPHFSISDLADANSDATTREDASAAAEDGAAEASTADDGQDQLSRQLQISSEGDGAIVLANGQRLLDIDYDLNVDGLRPGDIEVGKAVSLNGQRVGMINVSIDQNSQLHLSSADLSQFLPEEIYARLREEGDFVTFDTLRRNGLDIRYDPVGDMLQINT